MRALGTFVNSLIDRLAAHVSESHLPTLTIDGLSLADAEQLRRYLIDAGLLPRITDDLGDMLDGDMPVAGAAPVSISFLKPERTNEVTFVSTRAFGLWLMAPTQAAVVRVATCVTDFQTEAFIVCAPTSVVAISERRIRKSPRRIVRDTTDTRLVPAEVCPYLLSERSQIPQGEPVFEEWAARAASCIALCIANEVQHDRRLEFSGPPRFSIPWTDPGTTPTLVDWFEAIQDAARWVYDIDREVELRHRLFTQEFARLAFGQESLGDAILRSAEVALEGARIAYAFHLQEISKDALKGLADLRKAVSEETQKSFEATRQLGLSVAGALFYVIGLVAAKITAGMPTLLFGAMLILGVAYIGLVVAMNERAVRHQRALRSVWRSKVYRYLTDSEFQELVQAPTERAEQVLFVALWMVLVLSTAVFFIAAIIYC